MRMPESIAFPGTSLADAEPARRVLAICAFAALTAVGAWIRIPLPFTPVPITLQTFFVLLAGAWLGSRDGAASQVLYLAVGAAGLPVFTAGGGVAALAGPTAGFLLAFPVVAWIAGAAVPGSTLRTATVFVAAKVVLFAAGAAWLAIALDLDPARALALGVVPFLPGAAIKIVAATGLARTAPRAR